MRTRLQLPLATPLLAAAAVAVALALVPGGSGAAERERFDTRVLALIPPPGYPARAYVHPNGRIYEGTYESDAGASVPSRVFEFSGGGKLLRSFTISGQSIGQPHGIQAALSDSRGRLVLLDTSPARVLILNPDTGRQKTYATFADLPACAPAQTPPACSPNLADERPVPNYAAWGPDGSLYVTDYLQAVVWRVPPGGGEAEAWFADRRLDGVDFGTTGIVLAADRETLVIAQGSSAAGGDGNPATGKIYELPIRADGSPGTLTRLWESGPTELPDGFAIARSGRLYVPMVGTTAQIAVVSPEGEEIERFPEAPFSGENGSEVPFDSPSSAMFLDSRLIIANQSAVAGDRAHQAILDVEAGERGLEPLIPPRAGLSRDPVVCVVRRLPDRGPRRPIGKPKRQQGSCTVRVGLDRGSYRFRLRSGGKLVDSGRVRTDRKGRLEVRIEDVARGRYTLVVGAADERRRRSVRVKLSL